MIETYYVYTTGVNSMNISGILEHSPNIPKGTIFALDESECLAYRQVFRNVRIDPSMEIATPSSSENVPAMPLEFRSTE